MLDLNMNYKYPFKSKYSVHTKKGKLLHINYHHLRLQEEKLKDNQSEGIAAGCI